QSHRVQEPGDPLVHLGAGIALDAHRLTQRVGDRQSRVERSHRVLEHDRELGAELLAVLLRQLGGVRAVEADPATLELLELHDLHERGRLPAARLADQREALALMDVEGDAVYRALLPDLPAQHHALGDREDSLELLELEDLRSLGGVSDLARDRIVTKASAVAG